jgi:hypothetical protein
MKLMMSKTAKPRPVIKGTSHSLSLLSMRVLLYPAPPPGALAGISAAA